MKRSTSDSGKKENKRPRLNESFSKDASLKFITWNVNGLRAILRRENDPFRTFVRKHKPDILALSETKISEANLTDKDGVKVGLDSLLVKEGYASHFAFASKKGYSGTAIFVRKDEKKGTSTYKVTRGIGIPKHDNEGRVITLEFDDFFFVNSYVPNSGLKLDRLEYRTKEWDVDFKKYLVSLHATGKGVIWTGDLNVAHADSDIKYPKKSRNKVPGFCDGERENFGSIVGGDGLITEEAREKRTVLLGRPGPKPAEGTDDKVMPCLRWTDAWWKLHQTGSDETADEQRERAEGYTFWSYRAKGFEKNRGWRLDYFILSPNIADRLMSCFQWKELHGNSDHVPLALELSL